MNIKLTDIDYRYPIPKTIFEMNDDLFPEDIVFLRECLGQYKKILKEKYDSYRPENFKKQIVKEQIEKIDSLMKKYKYLYEFVYEIAIDTL